MQRVHVPHPTELAHRAASTRVTVTGPDGEPLADAEVRIEQTGHDFALGCTGFEMADLAAAETDPDGPGPDLTAQRLAELWFDLFDTAVLPFYWREFETEEGHPHTERWQVAARWLREQAVSVKGHPLAWHTLAPRWLLGRPLDQVRETLRARITRDVTDFAGLVSTWDAINEVVIMPVFTAEENAVTPLAAHDGRVAMVRLAVDAARAADPTATLLLNDFDLSVDYEHLIEDCLAAGVRLDGIGLQTHMHQGYRGEEATAAILERFARFGLPLHLTETTLVSGHPMPPEIVDLNDYQPERWPSTPEGEERQADELVRHYRTLLGHPAVTAITYWGLADGPGSWLGAPGGLVHADGRTKPAYDRLRALVKGDWWLAPTTVRTDDEGRLDLAGFRGEYRVTATAAPVGSGTLRLVDDRPGTTVRLTTG